LTESRAIQKKKRDKMKIQITPDLYISSEYFDKLNIVDYYVGINVGFYIIPVGDRELLYFHDLDDIYKWEFSQFKRKYGVNNKIELINFFEKAGGADFLMEDEVGVFARRGSILFNTSEGLEKFQNQETHFHKWILMIEELVQRGARTWYGYFCDSCFFGYRGDSVYLTQYGFNIENIDEVFSATFRTHIPHY